MKAAQVILVLTLTAVIVTRVTMPVFVRLSMRSHWMAVNFAGRTIPVTGGLMLLPGLSLAWLIYLTLVKVDAALAPSRLVQPALIIVWGFALLGFLDDQGGYGEHGGFKHHLTTLRAGELTTGALKALGGGVLAILAALSMETSFGLVVLNAVIIALTANLVNLLDLRPGRAVKGFGVLTLPALLASGNQPDLGIVLLPAIGAVALVGARDIKGELMLGDAGSNVLGALAGLALAGIGSWVVSTVVCLAAAGLNLWAEKVSLTEAIAKSPVLSWLDRLGRP